MTLQWSAYAIKTFQEASDYIACNFYPDYADAFDADVLETVEKLLDSPLLGKAAYPKINRPDLRKILCRNKNWWVYYRIFGEVIAISQIVYARQTNINPFGL